MKARRFLPLNTCVAKYDHHCAWINSDVGLNNYRYFMLFIVGHVVLCVYGTYLCFLVMWNVCPLPLLKGVMYVYNVFKFIEKWSDFREQREMC